MEGEREIIIRIHNLNSWNTQICLHLFQRVWWCFIDWLISLCIFVLFLLLASDLGFSKAFLLHRYTFPPFQMSKRYSYLKPEICVVSPIHLPKSTSMTLFPRIPIQFPITYHFHFGCSCAWQTLLSHTFSIYIRKIPVKLMVRRCSSASQRRADSLIIPDGIRGRTLTFPWLIGKIPMM